MKNMDVLIDSNMILDVLQKSNCDDVKLFDTLSDEELLAVSDKLVEQNLEAYKELAT